jgi:opacity protein-like surface antigen
MDDAVNWQYNVELIPVALESDPLGLLVTNQVTPNKQTFTGRIGPPISCTPITSKYSVKLVNGVVYSGTQTTSCRGREWNIGEAMSPIGFQWNFRPAHPLQPFLIGHGGYMYTTHPIPVDNAGSFNFTFDIGAGVELYRTATRSIRAEYRFHHISNGYTAQYNPGIDSGVFQLTYAFGR